MEVNQVEFLGVAGGAAPRSGRRMLSILAMGRWAVGTMLV